MRMFQENPNQYLRIISPSLFVTKLWAEGWVIFKKMPFQDCYFNSAFPYLRYLLEMLKGQSIFLFQGPQKYTKIKRKTIAKGKMRQHFAIGCKG